ncbi:MAG TPA: glycosyltransferase family 4 protein [Leptospiraceae bacterium]|nr:glycosyltransferase family 4 protein [Leptospiraceae bacterium]HMW04577.1 glycosyltransferase family 4 protein [Leptospiraceae bacterium]HMX33270.1 glycosyltransferase family 4 protein [Leptospiraceae bacterium]HMY30763.1 glycosyltransferase family 4 protein [Leptospiraceae bacterium]HMZ64341.1 glycosyltransferase family 4 protein [Leptospiraceae bacterium]
MKRIIQFSAGFNPGDAISNEMIILKSFFQEIGYDGEIFSENIGSKSNRLAAKYKSYTPRKGDCIIYHHSIHSSILEFVLNLDSPKVLIYHNVTPSYFFEPYDLKLTYYLKKGREELSELLGKFQLYFADSNFNKQELVDLGFENVHVLPIIYDFSRLPKKEIKKSKSTKDIIFVGRIAPNKKQDDIIKVAKVLKEYFLSDFRIHLVGYCSKELELYRDELKSLIDLFDLSDHVFFSDFINDDLLAEYYQNADLFLCMSEHEGFCVPLIESMYYEVPILAFDAGAVRDTLDGAGILFKTKDFPTICECIIKILSDKDFRDKIVEGQRERLTRFMQSNHTRIIGDAIKHIQI